VVEPSASGLTPLCGVQEPDHDPDVDLRAECRARCKHVVARASRDQGLGGRPPPCAGAFMFMKGRALPEAPMSNPTLTLCVVPPGIAVGEQTSEEPGQLRRRHLTVAAPEYAVPMEAGVYASTLTRAGSDGGGAGGAVYASTITTAPSSHSALAGGSGVSGCASTLTTPPVGVDRGGVADGQSSIA